MSFLATTGGIRGEDVRDLMTAVEYRFGRISRLPVTIEWLLDNGSCYIAGDTRSFARDIGLDPRTTPIESPAQRGGIHGRRAQTRCSLSVGGCVISPAQVAVQGRLHPDVLTP
jgi:transposase InsO family protein